MNEENTSSSQNQPQVQLEPEPQTRQVVLPGKPYKLRLFLLFSDLWLLVIVTYFFLIRNVVTHARANGFSFFSTNMLALYFVLAVTLVCAGFVLVFAFSNSIQTRIERDNDFRQNPNINVWLTAFDWTWVVLFVPTIAGLAAAGVLGYANNLLNPFDVVRAFIDNFLGAMVLLLFLANAVVVVFRITFLKVLLGLAFIAMFNLVLLLMGLDVFLGFYRIFRHLGITAEPLGYILLAYIGFTFLRLIYLNGLFHYVAISPNRLDEQEGLSETEQGTRSEDYNINIDTKDVVLRFFDIGRIIITFEKSKREPIILLVTQISKKSRYALHAASVTSVEGIN